MPAKTFTVTGFYGDMTVNAYGDIVIDETDVEKFTSGPYREIVSFDVTEWLRAYPDQEPITVRITDIGYWTANGHYEAPDRVKDEALT